MPTRKRPPQFLKDLFPDLEKPEDVLGSIKKMLGMEEDKPEPPAVEEPPAEEEPPAASE